MNTIPERISPLIVGFYAWIVTVFFGAVLLDISYARLVPEATAAFSEVSDFLLIIYFVTLVAAVGAIAFSWKSSVARAYFIASLVILVLELLVPLFFSQLNDKPGSGLATTIRILINGMASILALLGLYKIYKA